MSRNDLSAHFDEANIINIDEVAPLFFLKEGEEWIHSTLRELIDYDIHLHLMGRALALKKCLKEKRFESHHAILTHPKLPGWIIKGQHKFSFQRENFDHLLRVVMAKKMREVIQLHNLSIDIPEKRFVPAFFFPPHAQRAEKYYVLAKAFDCMNSKETAEFFHKLHPQKIRKIARDLAIFIAKTGYQDIHAGNIKIRRDGMVVILDTEPWGILIEEFDPHPSWTIQVKKGALLGLNNLYKDSHMQWIRDYHQKEKISEIKTIFKEEALQVKSEMIDE